ncbi:hypothetical protein AK88_03627 [Plasmodium fragile]|uniref:Uncharacterized protein n=1 Tax=Plasmodium fragile TaxID=5857 RepID=A0A0D9QI20_PLAFR|nr:uncharacterized protein AK88_03627 [Plasmodium fragile]KJP86715.1 hypothetical protein AK88_03627 [Plasmodium fragile]
MVNKIERLIKALLCTVKYIKVYFANFYFSPLCSFVFYKNFVKCKFSEFWIVDNDVDNAKSNYTHIALFCDWAKFIRTSENLAKENKTLSHKCSNLSRPIDIRKNKHTAEYRTTLEGIFFTEEQKRNKVRLTNFGIGHILKDQAAS